MVEFRQHLVVCRNTPTPHHSHHVTHTCHTHTKQGTFDQVCLGLDRKIGSLEQFTKFIKTRSQITAEYAKGLEKLSTKGAPSVFFEENGISTIMNGLIAAEAKEAKFHAELAETLHERIYKELVFTRDTMDKLRRTIENDGQAARKQYHDALLTMKRAKETYMKLSRDLEMNEWFQKDEAATATPQQQQKREKKVQKLRQDLQEATVQYRQSVEDATKVQTEFYQKRLPSSLDSLQRVFRQRAAKIHDSIRDYCIQSTSTLSQCLPVVSELQRVVEAFDMQNELEEYVTKTETFFRLPEDPKFEPFVRTPEGQVPPSVTAQQKSLYNKFHNAWRGADRKSGSGASAGGGGSSSDGGDGTGDMVKFAPTNELLGMSVQQLMDLQKTTHPQLPVPYVLVFLADCIIRLDGQHSDGIFRLSGSLPSMDRIKARLNVGDYVVPTDVHDASGVFKFILRSLPQPLVPTELYEAAIDEPETSHAVFAQIPEPNRTIAGFVVRFIHDYFLAPEIVDVTLMTPDNLATVLFPCLIRNPSSDLMEIMRHVEQEKTWMRKSFTSLDVSAFPTLDQCRELAGLTHGPDAAPTAPPAAAAAAAAATPADSASPTADEQTSTLMQAADPTPSEACDSPALPDGTDDAAAAPVHDASPTPTPPLPHPTNPPPKPPTALPAKPQTAAPAAPPSSLPLGLAAGGAPAGGAPALVLDFSSLCFDSDSSLPAAGTGPGPQGPVPSVSTTLPATFNFAPGPSPPPSLPAGFAVGGTPGEPQPQPQP